jgi:hypothetical protein
MTTASMERAVLRVINDMHDRLDQDLTIDDLARTARFSKFHFTRVFREMTALPRDAFCPRSAFRRQSAFLSVPTAAWQISAPRSGTAVWGHSAHGSKNALVCRQADSESWTGTSGT